MARTDQRYTVRFPHPDAIVTTQATTLYAPVYLDGALVAPSAATVSIFDGSGNATSVAAAAATITGSIAQYTVAANTFTVSPQRGWSVEWTLTIGGVATVANNDAVLALRELFPVVTDLDIYARNRYLDPAANNKLTAATNYQSEIDESWAILITRMVQEGLRPEWNRSPSSLREPHVLLALALIHEAMASRNEPAFMERAKDYRAQYERAWGAATYQLDVNQDRTVDDDEARNSISGPLWFGGLR